MTTNKDTNIEKEFKRVSTLSTLLKSLEKRSDAKLHYNHTMSIFESVFDFDLGFETAIEKVKDENSNFEISNTSRTLKNKISDLMFLDRLIMISGLSSFREDIMEEQIKNSFHRKSGDIEKLIDKLSKVK